MPNEQRIGALRGARTTSDITGQDTRLTGNRTSHLSRGSMINYQKDLGFSASEDTAKVMRKQKAAYEAEVAAREAAIADYEKQVAAAYSQGKGKLGAASSQLGNYSSVVSKAWKEQKKGWVPVTLVDEKNNKEGTYYLPRESATELAKTKGLWTNWAPENTELFVSTKVQGGRYRGQELHEQLGSAEKEIYNKWYEQSAPTILKEYNKAKGVLSGAYKDLESQYAQATSTASTARGAVSASKELNAMNWKDAKNDYNKKKETIAKIFSNFKVEEGK